MGFCSSVFCDGCDEEMPFFYTSIEEMVYIANKKGWIVREDGEARCPKCVKKENLVGNKAEQG